MPALTAQKQPSVDLGTFPHLGQLDQELLTCITPYDNFAELLGELRISDAPTTVFQFPKSQIIVVPPSFLKFTPTTLDGSNISDGKLRFLISAHPQIDVSRLRLGLKLFPKDGTILRQFVDLANLSWKITGDNMELTSSKAL